MAKAKKGPMTRRLIQLYAALLYNAHLKGFATGKIYTGPVKKLSSTSRKSDRDGSAFFARRA